MSKTIPMPGPDEFIKNNYVKDGKCCLVGWAMLADGYGANCAEFNNHWTRWVSPGPMVREIDKLTDGDAEGFNNSHTGAQCAAVYRKAAAKLGYKVENKPWRAER